MVERSNGAVLVLVLGGTAWCLVIMGQYRVVLVDI